MLSPQAIEKYRQLFLREYGIEITTKQAAEQAQRFLTIARVAMQPLPKRFERRYNELKVQAKQLVH